MDKIYIKVERAEYLDTMARIRTLEAENASLKLEIEKMTAKSEKAEIKTEKETKKGGNKQ